MRYLLGSSFGAIAQKKLSEKKTNHEFDTVASNQKAKKNIQRQYTLHYEFISYFISCWQNINFILNF